MAISQTLTSKFRPKDMQEAEERYGKIKRLADGRMQWKDEIKWMVLIELPSVARNILHVRNGKPVTTVYCNRDVARSLVDVIELLHIRKLLDQWKTYDGCFYVRDVRGKPGVLSTHAYGLSFDINAATNKLGTDGDMSPEFVNTWKELGFVWGGDFKSRKDPMHFQYLG